MDWLGRRCEDVDETKPERVRCGQFAGDGFQAVKKDPLSGVPESSDP